MYEHKNTTYIMFLHERFFKRSIFTSLYDIVVKNLQNRGITVVSINDIITYQNENSNKLSFNDNVYPDCNTLYIHMFNGIYYSDNLYSRKKLEKEREMLLLLAGKLGVKKITYNTEIIETIFDKIANKVAVHDVKIGMGVSKTTKKSDGIKGSEIYINRGAPVYLLSNTIQEVDENIRIRLGSMESKIFSYDFYKNNPKLEAFVYKRFEFKMQQLDYMIEVEDVSEKSYEVKSFLMGCGVGFSYENNTHTSEKINYTFEFFDDKELRLEFFEFMRRSKDKFINTREVYDNSDDKELAVNYICDHVISEIQKYNFIDMDMTKYEKFKDNDGYVNLYKKFIEWRQKQIAGTFEGICHGFVSSKQICEWIENTFNDNTIKDFKKINYDENEELVQGLNKMNINKSSSDESNSTSSSESINFIDSSDQCNKNSNEVINYSNDNEYNKRPVKRFSPSHSKVFINELYTKPRKNLRLLRNKNINMISSKIFLSPLKHKQILKKNKETDNIVNNNIVNNNKDNDNETDNIVNDNNEKSI
jgi:hypothetical protein